jgi:diguanylate cyclase (GGDEF)-like protein
MALTDVVSGLANRRAFEEVLQVEMARARRYTHPISLIILDLDSFKEYNDKWGHPAGDIRLREIANLLRARVREPDLAARYGGEEFAIILPNTGKSGAIRLAERLRKAAQASAPHHNGDSSPVSGYTISLGVATYPDDATSLEELLLAADNAELAAKRLGKNRVYAASASDKIQNL